MLNILRSTEDLTLKLGQLTWYYIRRIFIEKYAGNVHHRLVPDLYLVLVHSKKFSQCIQETLLFLIIYVERELIKNPQKIWCHFSFWTQSLFMEIIMRAEGDLELLTSPSSCYQTYSKISKEVFELFKILQLIIYASHFMIY